MIPSTRAINKFSHFCLRCFIEDDTNCKNLFTKNEYHEIYWVGEIAWNGKILFNSRQCLQRKFLWCVEYSVALINYAAPQNQHVGIIFRVNCPEDSLFTVVEFFNFQVHFPCKWEVFFWTIIFMIPQNLRKGEQYYRNFRPLTRMADYPHRSIFAIARKKFQQITRTGR